MIKVNVAISVRLILFHCTDSCGRDDGRVSTLGSEQDAFHFDVPAIRVGGEDVHITDNVIAQSRIVELAEGLEERKRPLYRKKMRVHATANTFYETLGYTS